MNENDNMPKAYEPRGVEDAIYAAWEKSGFFNPDNLSGEPFSVMMPPPNVTGILHLGHALENSLMDAMVRYQRMRGRRVLLVPGTDHAAIATQAKVEKQLMAEGISNPRQELGRERLVEKIREYAEASKQTILTQIRKLGTSCDWSRLAYTFDEPRNAAVKELFVRMYRDGLIYRGYRVVNWSVQGQSTSSDDEIVYVERPAKLYTFRYAKDFPIPIATTRPETKLGDTAVAVHPDDERYRKYLGQTFVVEVGAARPLTIKIIADEGVDPKFGTGALGVTPAHSPVDFAIYENQKAKGDSIGIVAVIGPDGKMTAEAGSYAGLSVEAAREKFVDWLRVEGLLIGEEEITQNVGTSDRYGDLIESIPMTQWWLDVRKPIPGRGRSLVELMREAVTTGLGNDPAQKITITPERFTKLYLDRVDNLRDWCLSRQLWWGHRIPVWYCLENSKFEGPRNSKEIRNPKSKNRKPECAEPIVSIEPVSSCPHCGGPVEQDSDTLDTWFSSGSWTFSTLGWPESPTPSKLPLGQGERRSDLELYHPTSWMQMGYEILYLWLMRMVLMSAYALEEVPFRDAYIHGMLRDQYGRKFSKSAGNGIDPIEVVNTYGADALRISLLLGVSPGNDSRYYQEKIESGRNFTNKLWNISRFVLTSLDQRQPPVAPLGKGGIEPKTLADRWILSRLSDVTVRVTKHLDAYEFSAAGELLRDFTWSEFADWYLEIAKVQDDENTKSILRHVLAAVLKMWHPFMPFVTEEIWKQMRSEGELLMVAAWPEAAGERDGQAEKEFALLREIVVAIRNARAEHQVKPSVKIAAAIATGSNAFLREESVLGVMTHLARLCCVEIDRPLKKSGIQVATLQVGDVKIQVEAPGNPEDEKVERLRLAKEVEELHAYIAGLDKKLANKEFLKKAPEKVVATMKANRDEAAKKAAGLTAELE